MNKEMKELFEKIEGLEWTVAVEGENEYRIGKFSPAGQDFSILVEGETTEELISSIYAAYENYDVSTETYLWLDQSGHGTNGAPHDMKDVLADMESCEAMILELHEQLSK